MGAAGSRNEHGRGGHCINRSACWRGRGNREQGGGDLHFLGHGCELQLPPRTYPQRPHVPAQEGHRHRRRTSRIPQRARPRCQRMESDGVGEQARYLLVPPLPCSALETLTPILPSPTQIPGRQKRRRKPSDPSTWRSHLEGSLRCTRSNPRSVSECVCWLFNEQGLTIGLDSGRARLPRFTHERPHDLGFQQQVRFSPPFLDIVRPFPCQSIFYLDKSPSSMIPTINPPSTPSPAN